MVLKIWMDYNSFYVSMYLYVNVARPKSEMVIL
jgi:hypothetical protein